MLEFDLGVRPETVDELQFRHQFDIFGSASEDIYKFSRVKWLNYEFSKVMAFVDQDEVISIAGCRPYDEYLRIGMNYYTLKSARKTWRSLLWIADGFADHSIRSAKDSKGVFISIYPHNSKLEVWAKKLKRGSSLGQLSNQADSVIAGIRKFQVLKEDMKLQGVFQTILYRALAEDFELSHFIGTLRRRA